MSQNLEGQPLCQQGFQQQQQNVVPGSGIGLPQTQGDGSLWEFADIGFDTMKKLWFVQLFDSLNQNVGFYTAKNISMNRGCAIQYQWKDTQGRPFWHVRERFQATDVEGFQIDMKGNLVINFKRKDVAEAQKDGSNRIPKNFAYLQYAYHLTSKDSGQFGNDVAPMGFVEFCNQNGEVIGRLNNRWIVVEDVERRTTGELPRIRIRVDRKDIGRIVASRSSVIIMSRDGIPSEQMDLTS